MLTKPHPSYQLCTEMVTGAASSYQPCTGMMTVVSPYCLAFATTFWSTISANRCVHECDRRGTWLHQGSLYHQGDNIYMWTLGIVDTAWTCLDWWRCAVRWSGHLGDSVTACTCLEWWRCAVRWSGHCSFMWQRIGVRLYNWWDILRIGFVRDRVVKS